MKISQEEVVDRQAVLHIELEDEDLDPYLDRGYRRLAQRTLIPGFRKGKAPRHVVERYVGREGLLNEVLDSMLPEVTSRAIAEQELETASLPQIELVELDPVKLKATVPLTPEVDLGPYRDIRIAQEEGKGAEGVTDEMVQQRLEALRRQLASWDPIDRPVEMGDMVTLQATATVEGRTVMDEKDAVFVLDEDGTRPFPGFSQRLVGLTKGEPAEFTLPIPEDHEDSTIAGKEVLVSATVGEVKEMVLPELDDEFGKSVGDGYESLEALRQEVERQLKAEAEDSATQRYRESVVTALVETATIQFPPLAAEHELEHMEDEQARGLSRVNVRMDDYLMSIGKTREEMREELREEAVQRLKRSAALSKMAQLEEIEVSGQEVDERMKTLFADSSKQVPSPEATEELKGSVQRMLLVEKAVDRLVAIARGEAEEAPKPQEQPKENSEDTMKSSDQEGGEADDTQA